VPTRRPQPATAPEDPTPGQRDPNARQGSHHRRTATRRAQPIRTIPTRFSEEPDNAWCATVELLRQLRLFTASTHAVDYFHRKDTEVPAGLPVTGLVLAPRGYYFASGKRGKALDPAWRLVDAVTSHGGLDVRLATWDVATRRIAELER
jgi:hypothetical protein